MAGFGVVASSRMAADFARWGYPEWFRSAVGAAQMPGSGLLLAARTTRPAALLLGAVMSGALRTHVAHNEWERALLPLALLLLGAVAAVRVPRAQRAGGEPQEEPGA